MVELNPAHLPEVVDRGRIRSGPAAFNIIDAEVVEGMGDAHLVVDGKVEILCLGAVPQGCIVHFDGSCHDRCPTSAM